MAPWVRTVFINQLPRFLVMRRPLYPISEMMYVLTPSLSLSLSLSRSNCHSLSLSLTRSKSSRRLMVRTCNGLELRDQIPPLPPPVALSR